VIIDDDDDYSLSHHHHHHHHHQLPAAYLQLSGKTAQDSPPMSPSDGRTLSEAGTLTPGCAYCAVPTAPVGPDCLGDRTTSAGDPDGSDGLTCVRCGHQHRVHLYNRTNSSDYLAGQHLHHCHQQQQQQQQQQDVI